MKTRNGSRSFSLIGVITSLAASTAFATGGPPKPTPTVQCRLIIEPKPGWGYNAFNSRFELQNTSVAPIKLEAKVYPVLSHVDLEVRDDKGMLLPKNADRYGAYTYSFDDEPRSEVIQPGRSSRESIDLFEQLEDVNGSVKPGLYTVEAVFRWNGQEVRSNRSRIFVWARDPDGWMLGWEDDIDQLRGKSSLNLTLFRPPVYVPIEFEGLDRPAFDDPKNPVVLNVDCRLVIGPKRRRNRDGFDAHIDLKNLSDEPLKITAGSYPISAHLDLDVRDDKGVLLPKSIQRAGDIFAPFSSEGQSIVVKAGETVQESFYPFVQVDTDRRPITLGTYTIEAVFRWRGQEVRSNRVTIQVLEDDKRLADEEKLKPNDTASKAAK